jgi:hypothetical protein
MDKVQNPSNSIGKRGNMRIMKFKKQHPTNQNQIRKFYKEIIRIRKKYKPLLTLWKGEDGQVISMKEEILKRWQEYY